MTPLNLEEVDFVRNTTFEKIISQAEYPSFSREKPVCKRVKDEEEESKSKKKTIITDLW